MPSADSGGWRLRTVTLAPAPRSRGATGRPSVPVPPVTRIDAAMMSPFTGKTKRGWNKGATTGEHDFLPVHKHAAFDGTAHRGSFEGSTACETGRRRRVHREPFRGSRPRRCRVSLRAGSARHP